MGTEETFCPYVLVVCLLIQEEDAVTKNKKGCPARAAQNKTYAAIIAATALCRALARGAA